MMCAGQPGLSAGSRRLEMESVSFKQLTHWSKWLVKVPTSELAGRRQTCPAG